jgi:hypothetical protein
MMQSMAGKFAGVVFWTVCAVFAFSFPVYAQSSDQAYPTAITENQISGTIKARDIGDPRVTTHYYTFNGRQGDLFINIVTKNLSGSVDVFDTEGMRPLTNIIVYADVAQSETGRVVYLRKPAKLILRVQGRTPNDDPAEYQIKFAGGFEAATPTGDEPPVPKVSDAGENNSGVRVNSVGTIIAVIPKPKPTPRPVDTAKTEDTAEMTKANEEKVAKAEEPETTPAEKPAEKATDETVKTSTSEPRKEGPKRAVAKVKPQNPRRVKPKSDQTANTTASDANTNSSETVKKSEPADEEGRSKPQVVITDNTAKKEPAEPKASPLAKVNLVILFKDGRKVERPMTQVERFTVDQTTLTVISTNGRIAKFSILEVASVTIQ